MKTPKLKPFKAWACVDHEGGVPVQSGACAIYYPSRPTECWHPSHYVRVIVRDARDDSEARLRRENARLRRLFRRTHKALVGGWYGEACELIAEELERKDRR